MSNPRLAGRYAKSLIDFSLEQNQLDNVCQDIKMLQSLCISNPDFVNMLKSPVIKSDKKEKIVEAVIAGRVGDITITFFKLLINKAREYNLPEIINAFIEQYNEINNIHIIKLTTAVPVSDALKDSIVNKIKTDTAYQKIELETSVKDELIGGFTLEIGDTLVDASILKDLNEVKKQFLNNEYVHNIR
jgi:F-type H+-transporting ATPase subunit delta